MMQNDDFHAPGKNVTKLNRKQLDDEVEKPWVRPSVKYSQHFHKENHPHHAGKKMEPYNYRTTTLGRHCVMDGCGSQLDLWDEGQVSEFAQFGSGVTNYFKFLKWCCWVFFILSVINIPAIVINSFGVSNAYGSFTLAVTTLGNLGDDNSTTTVKIPGCDEDTFQQTSCEIEKDKLAYYYSVLDVVSTIFVTLAWLWLRAFEKKEVDNLNRSTVTASDYTVRLPWIPADTKEAELRGHFARITGHPVAAVSLAYDNAKEIELYFDRGAQMKKRFNVIQKIRYSKTMAMKYGDHMIDKDEMNALLKERETITKKIEDIDKTRAIEVATFPTPIQAFVTFDTEKGYMTAIKCYSLSWWKNLCFPHNLRFKGHKIRVKKAPEPSTIQWENLECTSQERNKRKAITTFVAFVAIFFSVWFTFHARAVQQDAMDAGGKTECPLDWSSLTSLERLERATRNEEIIHCYCDQDPLASICKDYLKQRSIAQGITVGASLAVVVINLFFTWLMNKAAKFEKHQSLDSMEASILSRTFLLKFINTGCLILLYNQDFIQSMVGVTLNIDPDFSMSWYSTAGQSMFIIMIGTILSPHLSPLFRYYTSKKARERALDGAKGVLKGGEDKDVEWYTQDDLNAIFLGPEFHMDFRYSQLLVNFYICFMYQGGMPLMPILGFFSFFVAYWVDKFLFCNFYRIPPMYSDTMSKTATGFVGYGIVVHLLMTIWMYGNKAIFQSAMDESIPFDHNEYEKNYTIFDLENLKQKHMVPLICLLLAFLTLSFLNGFFKQWCHMTRLFVNFVTCGSGTTTDQLMSVMNSVDVTYTRAKERGLIKGLNNYNILQNPNYREAFGVDEKFAAHHSHVSSIRKLKADAVMDENRESEGSPGLPGTRKVAGGNPDNIL